MGSLEVLLYMFLELLAYDTPYGFHSFGRKFFAELS